MKDVMLDFETWGQTAGCAIRSMASIGFDPYRRTMDPNAFYSNVDDASQLTFGLNKEEGTIEWWSRQSADAANALLQDQRPIEEVLQKWVNWWLGQGAERIWSQGSSFDTVILEHLLKKVLGKQTTPWKFWNTRDTRTVYDVFGYDTRQTRREGPAHHSLFDCKYQINCIWDAQERGRKRWVTVA